MAAKDPMGMGVETMRPKMGGRLMHGAKGPKRPRNNNNKLKRGHRVKKFTKKLRRS